MPKGQRLGGRQKGTPNKVTTELREAILTAARQEGADGEGKDGLTGFCRKLAREDLKAFSNLLGKVLPKQITGDGGGPIKADVSIDVKKLSSNVMREILDASAN